MQTWTVQNTDFSNLVSSQSIANFHQLWPNKLYEKGDIIFHAGDSATDLHIIAQGQVKLIAYTPSGVERIVAICGPNDFIGEAFLQDNAAYQVDAVALAGTTTYSISRQSFLEMTQRDPSIALTFSQIMVSYLSHCREQLSGSYAPVKTRLAKVFLEQVERFGQTKDDMWANLNTNLKHEELAAMIRATRVSVSVTIAELRDEGVLQGTRGQYTINVPALTNIAEN